MWSTISRRNSSEFPEQRLSSYSTEPYKRKCFASYTSTHYTFPSCLLSPDHQRQFRPRLDGRSEPVFSDVSCIYNTRRYPISHRRPLFESSSGVLRYGSTPTTIVWRSSASFAFIMHSIAGLDRRSAESSGWKVFICFSPCYILCRSRV